MISYYLNAKDNIGTNIAVKAAIDLIRVGLSENTKAYRLLLHEQQKEKTALEVLLHKHAIPGAWMQLQLLYEEQRKVGELEKEKPGSQKEKLADLKADILDIENHPPIKLALKQDKILKAITKRCEDYKKLNFTAVTWSGQFSKRAKHALQAHSGLVCMDIDKLTQEQHDSFKARLKDDPYVYFMFTSPSAAGLKIVFKIPPFADTHLEYFKAISEYLLVQYGVERDTTGKDTSRLCFLCADPDCYLNVSAVLFDKLPQPEAAPPAPAKKQPAAKQVNIAGHMATAEDNAETLDDIHNFTANKIPYAEHSRNKFLYLFCSNCCRKGVPEEECRSYCNARYTDREKEEIKQTVDNAYLDNKDDFGKFKKGVKKSKGKPAAGSVAKAGAGGAASPDGDAKSNGAYKITSEDWWPDPETVTKFWYIVQKTDKTTGEVKESVEVDSTLLIDFIEDLGFYIYEQEEAFEYIHVTGRKIRVINYGMLKRRVFDYLRCNLPKRIYRRIHTGNKSFLGEDKFSAMVRFNINVKRDTKDISYFYFNNCIVHVTATGITTHPYDSLDGYIWSKQVNKRNFTLKEFSYCETNHFKMFDDNHENWPSEFARFVRLVSYNPNNDDERDLEFDERLQRFEAFCTSIGYLLDGYKHPAYRKAIYAIDHKIGEKNESNGRSGKSLLPIACGNLKIVTTISGGTYDPKYQFRFEPISIDTQIVNFNDMKPGVDMRETFELTADDYMINKRNTGMLHIPYTESGKVYVSMNGIPKGDGDSYEGRGHILEYSDFFNARHTPYDYFNGALFIDWNDEQWNNFFNFMLMCVKMHKRKGLVPYPNGNFKQRRVKNECPDEFVSFLEMFDESASKHSNMPRDAWNDKKTFIAAWNAEAKAFHMPDSSAKNILDRLKIYCRAEGLLFFEKNSNSLQSYWIGKIVPDNYYSKTIKCHVDNGEYKKILMAARQGELKL